MKTKISKKTFFFISAIVLLSSLSFAPKAQALDIDADELIRLTNAERSSRNLKPLAENTQLFQAAKKKAEDMIAHDYFDHISPNGDKPWNYILREGYEYNFAGENLAIDFSTSKEIMKAWMDSKTHKDNILNANYEDIGIALSQGEYKKGTALVVVQMFGKKLPKKPEGEVRVIEYIPEVPVKESTGSTLTEEKKDDEKLTEKTYKIMNKQNEDEKTSQLEEKDIKSDIEENGEDVIDEKKMDVKGNQKEQNEKILLEKTEEKKQSESEKQERQKSRVRIQTKNRPKSYQYFQKIVNDTLIGIPSLYFGLFSEFLY